MKKSLLTLLTLSTLSFSAFAKDNHYNPELLEIRKPYGKIYSTEASMGEKIFMNSVGILDALYYKRLYRGTKEYFYFSCDSDNCENLELVVIYDRQDKEADSVYVYNSIETSKLEEFISDVKHKAEDEKNKILDEKIYDSSKRVSAVPDTPVVVYPATAIALSIDTLKAPIWNLIKNYRANSFGKNTKTIIEGILDKEQEGKVEKIDADTFSDAIKSLYNREKSKEILRISRFNIND